MNTDTRLCGCVLGMAVLAIALAGCGGNQPKPQSSQQRVQEDSDRFFDTLRREERRHETGPGGTQSGGGEKDERVRRP